MKLDKIIDRRVITTDANGNWRSDYLATQYTAFAISYRGTGYGEPYGVLITTTGDGHLLFRPMSVNGDAMIPMKSTDVDVCITYIKLS